MFPNFPLFPLTYQQAFTFHESHFVLRESRASKFSHLPNGQKLSRSLGKERCQQSQVPRVTATNKQWWNKRGTAVHTPSPFCWPSWPPGQPNHQWRHSWVPDPQQLHMPTSGWGLCPSNPAELLAMLKHPQLVPRSPFLLHPPGWIQGTERDPIMPYWRKNRHREQTRQATVSGCLPTHTPHYGAKDACCVEYRTDAGPGSQ